MSFFNDTLPAFRGIAIGWDGYRSEFPTGDYSIEMETPPSEFSRCGFEPIGLEGQGGDGVDALDGVGLFPGQVHVNQTPTFHGVGGRPADRVWPTLNATTINSDPAPREPLEDGQWGAWIVYKEILDAHEARVIFTLAGAEPSIDRGEKSWRVALFTVENPAGGGAPIISMDPDENERQEIDCDLEVSIDQHQWRFQKTGDDTFIVRGGVVYWPNGNHTPIHFDPLVVLDSPEFTVTAGGTMWLKCQWTWGQQLSAQKYDDNADSLADSKYLHLVPKKIQNLAFDSFLMIPDMIGSDAIQHYPSSGHTFFKLLDFVFEAGQAYCSVQYANGPLFANEMVDLTGCQEETNTTPQGPGQSFPPC